MNFFSRRSLLKGAGALALAPTLARAQAAPKPSAVVLVYLVGGYNALFGSADSFLGSPTFGVTSSNLKSMGNGLFVDDVTYGQKLGALAQSHIATVGVNHHLSSHLPAQLAHWSGTNDRSHPLMLANALNSGTTGPHLPCVIVGAGKPAGLHPPENGITMQRASDLGPTLDLFGLGTSPAPDFTRRASLGAMKASQLMSSSRLTSNPTSLRSAGEGYNSAIGVLGGTAASFDYNAISTAYGVTGTAVTNFNSQMLAAEVMIRLGTKVVIALSGGWDTHGDIYGTRVRTMMNASILPGMSKFLERMMAANSGYDVTLAVFGDFARSVPGSDHASALSATVFGPRVKVGTTGKMDSNVGLPSGTPGVDAFWSYLSEASRATTNPFGANPHTSILLP